MAENTACHGTSRDLYELQSLRNWNKAILLPLNLSDRIHGDISNRNERDIAVAVLPFPYSLIYSITSLPFLL